MNQPFDVDGSSVSVLSPGEPSYAQDAESYGVTPASDRHVVGIGPDTADVVLFGTREALIKVARDMLSRLGA